MGQSINDSDQHLILNDESQETFKKEPQTKEEQLRLPPIHQKRYVVSESQDGLEGTDVNSLKGQKHFSRRNREHIRSEKKLDTNERDKARQFLATAGADEEMIAPKDNNDIIEVQSKVNTSKYGADLFHLDPEN